MKLNDTVYFHEQGSWFKYTVVACHEFRDALTIANGVGERIVTPADVITPPQFDALVLEEERRMQKPRLQPIIDAFNAGYTTSIKLADHMKIHHLAARGKLLACHRLGFIALPLDKHGFPDPNPKHEPVATDKPNLG
jgi:hypothetical protein